MVEPQTYVGYLRALLRETEQLQEAAADEEWERVVAHLDARQTLMAQIDALPSAPLPEAEASLANSLLDAIISMDGATAPKVLATLETTRAAIAEGRLTRTTIAAYRSATQPKSQTAPSRFLDKQR